MIVLLNNSHTLILHLSENYLGQYSDHISNPISSCDYSNLKFHRIFCSIPQPGHVYFVYLLNKPKGYICTNSDTHERKKVVDLLPSNQRLFTIGRLDRDTTGAILVTNDGDLANQLMHPRFNKEKIYLAETKKDIDDKDNDLIEI